jgi:hypothetical protein
MNKIKEKTTFYSVCLSQETRNRTVIVTFPRKLPAKLNVIFLSARTVIKKIET